MAAQYQEQQFAITGLKGLSDKQIAEHLKLYAGYVKNVNKIESELERLMADSEANAIELSELKRRYAFEWNGMRLHELYFGNMVNGLPAQTGGKELGEGELKQKIVEEWGSFEMWEKDFQAMGAMRGIGWVVLYFDAEAGRLFNVWINEHDAGHLSGATPILVMDVFEHAFMLDYGIKRADYIAAFWKAIDWSVAESRLK